MPSMNDEQMYQAIHAYYQAYERGFVQRWMASPWTPLPGEKPLEWPTDASQPMPKSQIKLPRATAVDKAGAIDVEFVRVR